MDGFFKCARCAKAVPASAVFCRRCGARMALAPLPYPSRTMQRPPPPRMKRTNKFSGIWILGVVVASSVSALMRVNSSSHMNPPPPVVTPYQYSPPPPYTPPTYTYPLLPKPPNPGAIYMPYRLPDPDQPRVYPPRSSPYPYGQNDGPPRGVVPR